VVAAVLGLFGAVVEFVGNSIARAFNAGSTPLNGPRQHVEWDLFLIALAVFLVWYGARRGARGPTYVGGLALTAFIVSIGVEVTRLVSGNGPPEGAFVGWPLLLLLVGAAGLVAGFWAPPPATPPASETPPA
jgi:hypothetical protein